MGKWRCRVMEECEPLWGLPLAQRRNLGAQEQEDLLNRPLLREHWEAFREAGKFRDPTLLPPELYPRSEVQAPARRVESAEPAPALAQRNGQVENAEVG
jgi:hypothetical protein